MIIRSTKSTIKETEYIEIQINSKIEINQKKFQIQIAQINHDYTNFIMSFCGDLIRDKSNYVLKCKPVSQLKEGFYIVSALDIFDYDLDNMNQINIMNLTIIEPILFIIDNESSEISYQNLIEKYITINKERDNDFLSGIGDSSNSKERNVYLGIVFIKNCLLTTRMRIGQYELIPYERMGFDSELQVVNSFFSDYGLEVEFDEKSISEKYSGTHPVAVVHFPVVYASSEIEALKIIFDESSKLNNILSVMRMSNGNILGMVVINKKTGEKNIELGVNNYHGNILGGFLSGENPSILKKRIEIVRNNTQKQLMLSLYNEALNEMKPDFQYFRFWNLLELIARSKDYIGISMTEWDGTPIKNKKGHVRKIQDDACDLVYELIKSCFKSIGKNESEFADKVNNKTIKEQMEIWYRHRNCVVHSGGCQPWNSRICKRDIVKYITCHDAMKNQYFSRIDDNNFDWYLWSLKFTALDVINYELENI